MLQENLLLQILITNLIIILDKEIMDIITDRQKTTIKVLLFLTTPTVIIEHSHHIVIIEILDSISMNQKHLIIIVTKGL